MRLRIHALAEPPPHPAALEPDQSPNLDRTIAGPSALAAGGWSSDSGEVLAKNQIMTLEGWLRIARPGAYRFHIKSDVGFAALIGAARLRQWRQLKEGGRLVLHTKFHSRTTPVNDPIFRS